MQGQWIFSKTGLLTPENHQNTMLIRPTYSHIIVCLALHACSNTLFFKPWYVPHSCVSVQWDPSVVRRGRLLARSPYTRLYFRLQLPEHYICPGIFWSVPGGRWFYSGPTLSIARHSLNCVNFKTIENISNPFWNSKNTYFLQNLFIFCFFNWQVSVLHRMFCEYEMKVIQVPPLSERFGHPLNCSWEATGAQNRVLATAQARTKQEKRREDHKGPRAAFLLMSVIPPCLLKVFMPTRAERVPCACRCQSSSHCRSSVCALSQIISWMSVAIRFCTFSLVALANI